MKEKIVNRIKEVHPYFTAQATEELADRLMKTEEALTVNLTEWLEGKALSDIWVRDKYCIGSVMHLRASEDFVSAFIALDDYAKDESKEQGIWRMRL